jgi:hypothetical protein
MTNLEPYEGLINSQPFFTVKEFASLCGKSTRWAYDRIYAGDLQVLRKGGVTAISSDEIRRFLAKEGPYQGKRATPVHRTKPSGSGSKRVVKSTKKLSPDGNRPIPPNLVASCAPSPSRRGDR